MLSRTFKWGDSDNHGEGWVPAWMKDGDPVSGFGAAHDTLEHFPRCIGGFEGEMLAFGAMHMVRLHEGWNGFSTIYENQASDIHIFLRNVLSGDQYIKDPGPINEMRLPNWYYPDEMRLHTRKAILELLEDESWQGSPQDLLRKLPRKCSDRICGWIARGVMKAQKRFAQWDLTPGELLDIFKEVQAEFDRKCKASGEYGDFIRVQVDFATRGVRVYRGSDSRYY